MFKIFNDYSIASQSIDTGWSSGQEILTISVDWKDEKRMLLLTGIQSFMEDDLM